MGQFFGCDGFCIVLFEADGGPILPAGVCFAADGRLVSFDPSSWLDAWGRGGFQFFGDGRQGIVVSRPSLMNKFC